MSNRPLDQCCNVLGIEYALFFFFVVVIIVKFKGREMSYYVTPCAPIGPRELIKSSIVSVGHIAHSCCYVVPVVLLNKELRRQNCDTFLNVTISFRILSHVSQSLDASLTKLFVLQLLLLSFNIFEKLSSVFLPKCIRGILFLGWYWVNFFN